jgi:decaprenyl-phosphate phosphoribosyltransferase
MARSTSSPVAASGTADHAVPGRSLALDLLLSLRPAQWTKNLLVFAGLLFGRRLFDPASVVEAVSAFAVFCALSGAVYLVNDVADRDSDRLHPLKSQRPIASGALAVPVAIGAALALGSGALASAWVIGPAFAAVAAAYLALQVL